MQVKDKVISKVYPGKELENKGQFFNFYLSGGTKKFGWFAKKGSTQPKAGMQIALLEYEEVQQGEYLNNKVKNIVWRGATDQPEVTNKFVPCFKDNPIWFCVAYCKDLKIPILNAMSVDQLSSINLKELAIEVAEAAIDMYDRIQAPKIQHETEPPLQEEEEPPPSDDDIPY